MINIIHEVVFRDQTLWTRVGQSSDVRNDHTLVTKSNSVHVLYTKPSFYQSRLRMHRSLAKPLFNRGGAS